MEKKEFSSKNNVKMKFIQKFNELYSFLINIIKKYN